MDIIDRSFAALHGVHCWKVEWEPHLGLKLSFGRPRMTICEPRATDAKSPRVRRQFAHRRVDVKGEWWLWAWCGRWSLKLGDSPERVTSSTPAKTTRVVLDLLDGQMLTGAMVNRDTGATTLAFDLGAELRLWGSVSDDREIYELYKPNRYVLTMRTDGMYSHELDTRPNRWRSSRAGT